MLRRSSLLSVALVLAALPLSTPSSAAAQGAVEDPGATSIVARTGWDAQVSGKTKKRKPVYTTPGYKPQRKKVALTPVEPPLRPLLRLSDRAREPRLLLDAAGTAHITWVEAVGPNNNSVVYCRLPRGAQACEVVKRWPDVFPYIESGVPLALDDDLAILSSQYPQPDPGFPYSRATFLDLSVDGGDTFSPSSRIGNLSAHEAAVTGPQGDPLIVGITDTVTGGTSVQAYKGGSSAFDSALIGPGDEAIDGRVVDDGGRPLAAWNDFSGNGFLGRWTGNGSPNDATKWERSPIGPAADPWLSSGPAGTFLLSRLGLSGTSVLRRVDGLGVGGPIETSPGSHLVVEQDGASGVYVGGSSTGAGQELWVQRFNGTGFDAPTVVARSPDPSQGFSDPRIGVRPDGGGVIVASATGGLYAPLYVTSFGTLAPTGQLGLGKRAGGGTLDPGTEVQCGRIAFGAVELRTLQGCFFNGSRSAAASSQLSAATDLRVSTGPVDLNGLILRPNPGVQIQINPVAKTIDTTGPISVDLDAPGGPVTLWRGELHLKLPRPQAKTVLASFDTDVFAPVLKGFPIDGRVDVELTDKGVEIPVNLRLPKAFGGVRGEAVLKARVGAGLQLDSLRIEIPEAFLGGPTLRNALLTYTASSDEWYGQAELYMPPGRGAFSFAASVRFRGGDFREATAEVGLPYPGLPLFEGVYLAKVRGAFGLEPTKISVGGTFGIFPVAAGQSYLVDARADVIVTFGSPWRVEVKGGSTVLGLIPVANTYAIVTGDGFVKFTGDARLMLGSRNLGVGLNSGLSLGFDLQREVFSGRFNGGSVEVYFPDPVPNPSVKVSDVVISSKGVGLCAGGGGFRYRFEGRDLTLFPPLGSCNLGPIELVLTPRQATALRKAASLQPRGKRLAAQAVPVALSKSKHAFLHIDGDGGAPDVTLVDPSGRSVQPVRPATLAEAKSARVVALSADAQTIISVRNPQRGKWQVVPRDGSAPITRIQRTQSEPAPRLRARFVRVGGATVMKYTLRGGTKLGAAVREVGKNGIGRMIGQIKQGQGSLRFPPGGTAGRRAVYADLTRDGIPIDSVKAGSYTAPRPSGPARPRGVRIARAKGGVVVKWGRVARADAVLIRVTSGDGLSRRITLGGKARSVRIAGIDRDARAAVAVQAVTAGGRTGPVAKASLRVPTSKR